MTRLAYFDCAATTRPAPEVLDAMRAVQEETWGNASSAHGFGQAARRLVEDARGKVAALIGARPEEIIFTSGATESNNTVFQSIAPALKGRGRRIVTTAIEHPSVLESVQWLETQGWSVARAGVDGTALVAPAEIGRLLGDGAALVSVMLANNEVGTIEPVAEIAALARARGAALHTDATQAVGRIPVDVNALGVDYLSLSGHKLHGPKGVGALFVRRGAKVSPLLHGGEQEGGRRSGTLNVPGIVGLGAAAALAARDLPGRAARIAHLRDALEQGLMARIPNVILNGHPTRRLPSHANLSVSFVEGESMMMGLDLAGVAVSTGSACSSGSLEPSHVLTAMGCDAGRAHASLRLSVGYDNTEEDVARALETMPAVVERLRKMSPTWADYKKKQAVAAAPKG